jgi:anaerobic magnesium-protoporphyrin IX monomethyl ester cyclase
MRVLLLSMPDAFEHTPTIAIRMPNGGLASLAGNVDPHHAVAIADLVLVQSTVKATIERLMREFRPDVVGLSVMTFQRVTARRVIALIRALDPRVRVVVGGYDPSLAPEAWIDASIGVDAIVRGEGDITFRQLLRSFERNEAPIAVDGVWYRDGASVRRNPSRGVARLADGAIRRPNRRARVLSGYTFLGRQIDVIETSRGCTFDCSFCSIIEMRGRNFHRLPISQVIDDIRDAAGLGARTIFFVDDNITLDVERFTTLCHAIIEAGLTHLDYLVQAMTASIATHGEQLAPLMRRAGFRYVFLGIENVIDADLGFLKARAKNTDRRSGLKTNASAQAATVLRRHGMFVVGGLIVGNPDDGEASIQANLDFARKYVDWPYIQHPTPYPGTPMTQDFESRGLIAVRSVEEYDGTTAVTRSTQLSTDRIEFLRWKAERWLKVRHMSVAVRHDPLFVIRHAVAMMAHTFRGSTWRSLLGLESLESVFLRYRSIRARERDYLDVADPMAGRPPDDRRNDECDAGRPAELRMATQP